MNIRFIFSWAFITLFLIALQAQEERITNFDVFLKVNVDRSIEVTENITVYSMGKSIKRGITRQFPRQRDMQGKRIKMKYEIISVQKDGLEEPFMQRSESGDKVLYIGRSDQFLSPGTYTYTIQYRVPNQVGFFEEYDEIYWNAIGSNVRFLVDKASCTVQLPEGGTVLQEAAYMGRFGSANKDFTKSITNSQVLYRTTRILQAREAFTISVGFPKGIVQEPGILEKFGSLLVIIFGVFLLIPYYIYTWWKYGVDPPKPPPYPLFESPEGFSPSSISYISKERYQRKSFIAAVISLAIKGFIRIEEKESGALIFKKKVFNLIQLQPDNNSLPLEESRIMETLFRNREIVSIDGEYHEYIKDAYQDHKESLSIQHRSFVREGHNSRFLVVPVLGTIGIGGLAAFFLANNPLSEGANMVALGLFVPLAIISLLIFIYLIKKPTVEKLSLQSMIEGFKMYLEMAEKDRLQLLNPPDRTPSHFEEMLPFAFALGVEHKWSQKFKKVLEDAQYQPQWSNRPPVYFAGNFGNDFSRSFLSSATPPSQDGSGGGFSGSGGGGFAGGGGGGGGVGGW